MTKSTIHHPGGKDETGTPIGPRGFHTKAHGDVILNPGEVRDNVDLDGDEHDRLEAAGLQKGDPRKASEDDDGEPTVGTARAGAGEGANEPGKLKAGDGPKPKTGEEPKSDKKAETPSEKPAK